MKETESLSLMSQFQFSPDGNVEVMINLGINGSYIKLMFYFRKDEEGFLLCDYYKEFLPGELGRKVQTIIKVDVRKLVDNSSIGVAIDEAWMGHYRDEVLAKQIAAKEEDLARLWGLRKQMTPSYKIIKQAPTAEK